MIWLRLTWTSYFQVQPSSNFTFLWKINTSHNHFYCPVIKFYSKSKDLTVHRIDSCLWATCWASTEGFWDCICPLKVVLSLMKSHCSIREFNSSVWIFSWPVSSVHGHSQFALIYRASMQWAPWGKTRGSADLWLQRTGNLETFTDDQAHVAGTETEKYDGARLSYSQKKPDKA